MLGHLGRTKMLGLLEQFGVARLLGDVVELVYMGYPLSVIRGLVRSLLCSRVAKVGRKTVKTVISLCKNRMVLDDKKQQRQKPRHGAARRPQRFWRGSSTSSSSSSPSRMKRRGKQRRVKEAQTLLEKHDPQYQRWLGAWSSYEDSSCFSWRCILGM